MLPSVYLILKLWHGMIFLVRLPKVMKLHYSEHWDLNLIHDTNLIFLIWQFKSPVEQHASDPIIIKHLHDWNKDMKMTGL